MNLILSDLANPLITTLLCQSAWRAGCLCGRMGIGFSRITRQNQLCLTRIGVCGDLNLGRKVHIVPLNLAFLKQDD